MNIRVLLAGVAGGIVLFAWGAVSHVALGLGSVGFKQLPKEDSVLAMMQQNLPEPGLYFFPWMNESPGMTKEQQQAEWDRYLAKYKSGPAGLMVYRPVGGDVTWGPLLARELAANIAAALVGAILLGIAAASLSGYGARVLFVALLGLLPGLEIDVSYWNWYGFPMDYTVAVMADHVIAWTLAGLVMALIVKGRS